MTDLEILQNELKFWKERCEQYEAQIATMGEEDFSKRILFERVEAERNALWEVIRVQAGKKPTSPQEKRMRRSFEHSSVRVGADAKV